MKVTKLHEVSGEVGSLKSTYLNDFDVIDDVIMYNIKSTIVRMRFVGEKEEVERKELNNENESYGDGSFGAISIDRSRRLLVTSNCSGGMHFFKISDDYDLEKYRNDVCLYNNRQNKDHEFAISVIEINEKKNYLLAGVGWSNDERRQGEVFLVKNYFDEESTEIVELFKQTEGVKTIRYLQTNHSRLLVGGGTFYGKDHEWKLFDFSRMKLLVTSDKVHKRPIRDIVTFIKNKGTSEEKEEEMVVTCSSDQTIGIWKLNGKIVTSHNLGEMHSALLFVNHEKIIVSTNWGSIFTFDVPSKEHVHAVPKDNRGSTTHVGRCVWIGKTNRFVAIHGDSTIRVYSVEGVEREILDYPDLLEDLDEKGRREFICSEETIESSKIQTFCVEICGGLRLQIQIPIVFFV